MKLSYEPDTSPGQISWHYERAEIIADGVVHAIGVCLGLIGAAMIIALAVKMDPIDVAPIWVYVIGLVTMLALSAAYNMWPVSPAKWVLRRFDHSAIYLLIAGPTRHSWRR
jgi:hemolysin III